MNTKIDNMISTIGSGNHYVMRSTVNSMCYYLLKFI